MLLKLNCEKFRLESNIKKKKKLDMVGGLPYNATHPFPLKKIRLLYHVLFLQIFIIQVPHASVTEVSSIL